jgi:hydrogenase nickel incorporation protein HypB
MCATCGCGGEHSHRTVKIEQDVLGKNDHLAMHNRQWLKQRGVVAFNLMSSPGSGKTTLLERTVREAGLNALVIEGDQATERDANRIRVAGARAVQINTGAGCHLDAHMVGHALEDLAPAPGNVVFIENVGNLVCPALFDLGESAKVVIASVTEGDDKPLKYPHMFRAADLILLNKVDLLPYVPFDLPRFIDSVSQVNARVRVMRISATRGDGLSGWHAWIRSKRATRHSGVQVRP